MVRTTTAMGATVVEMANLTKDTTTETVMMNETMVPMMRH
jgi:hypothetical protein